MENTDFLLKVKSAETYPDLLNIGARNSDGVQRFLVAKIGGESMEVKNLSNIL